MSSIMTMGIGSSTNGGSGGGSPTPEYLRDQDGNLILDQDGNPIPIQG